MDVNTSARPPAAWPLASQVMRGNEDFSFLIDMLLNIVLDMRSFLAILGAAIVVNAFAYRLLRSDTDAYGNTGAAVLSSYALLMHADGVGDHDIYMSGCACTRAAVRCKCGGGSGQSAHREVGPEERRVRALHPGSTPRKRLIPQEPRVTSTCAATCADLHRHRCAAVASQRARSVAALRHDAARRHCHAQRADRHHGRHVRRAPCSMRTTST
eukprot:3819921-Prymnesium_polylepis.1